MALERFRAPIRTAHLAIRAWIGGWTRSDILAVLALLGSAAAFTLSILIRVDDLKLMVADWPSMNGTRQKVTITTPQLMAFLNMGNQPIAVTRIDLFVDDTDVAGKSFLIKQFQIKPFIVDGGKILTKELGTSDNTVVFNPSEIFKISDKNGGQTMNLKLRAGFWLLTPDGAIFTSIDLHSELALPPSGAAIQLGLVILSAEGPTRVSPIETLYHHRSFRVPW
jgi:hypothetical protein